MSQPVPTRQQQQQLQMQQLQQRQTQQLQMQQVARAPAKNERRELPPPQEQPPAHVAQITGFYGG